MNRNVVATINPNEHENVLLRYSMNRIQSKDHKIGNYEMNKTSFSCF